MHVNDVHAPVPHLLGLDHTRVTFQHNGGAERATLSGGGVNHALIG